MSEDFTKEVDKFLDNVEELIDSLESKSIGNLLDITVELDLDKWINENKHYIEDKLEKGENFAVVRNIPELELTYIAIFDYIEERHGFKSVTNVYREQDVIISM